ncbi:MAG: hypothetical protein ACI87O_003003 [Planctomycetota bacterium]|jgi:hypothetical protein
MFRFGALYGCLSPHWLDLPSFSLVATESGAKNDPGALAPESMLLPSPRNRLLLVSATLVAVASLALVCVANVETLPANPQGQALGERSNRDTTPSETVSDQPFPGLFALGPIRLQPGAIIDSWSSPIEGFLQGHTQDSGQALVRSIGPIDLEFASGSAPTVIVGHANAALGSEVRMQKGSFVTGSITSSNQFEFLPALPTSAPQDAADLHLSGGFTSTDQVNIAYGQVRVTAGATWVLRGPLELQVRDLEVSDRATLIVDTAEGPVTLRVAERFIMDPSTQLFGDPNDLGKVLILVGQGQARLLTPLDRTQSRSLDQAQAMRDRLAGKSSIQAHTGKNHPEFSWRCSGQFYGLVYAPFSDIQLQHTLRFHGTLTGKSIQLDANTHVTCDERSLEAWNLSNTLSD